MKSIRTVKIGSLREIDPEERGKIEVWDVPEDPVGPEDVKNKGCILRHMRLRPAPDRRHFRMAGAFRNGP